MIVVTGAAGFIGSCLTAALNAANFKDLVLVDDFSNPAKIPNLEGKVFSKKVHRDEFPQWLRTNQRFVQFVFHIGARTDTTEFNTAIFDKLNLNYSKEVWTICTEYGIPLVYASSAATYGSGVLGYDDDHSTPKTLQTFHALHPLNPYGDSKHRFDLWVLEQKRTPSFWAGLKFFNVYGPNEYHKGRMASVIFHAFNQVEEKGSVRLFRSHNPKYKDGEQLRDFIYVKDVCGVCLFLLHHRKNSGIYNLGSGKARTFIDLAHCVFEAMGKAPQIDFIDTPADIRDKYQYFTEAQMKKLKKIGFPGTFTSLEDGIKEYVKKYLVPHNFM